MKIIKRDGSEMEFDRSKIEAAVQKANESVDADDRLNRQQIAEIAQRVEEYCHTMKRAMSVEEIQDQVENHLMELDAYALARCYITYRYTRALVRKSNTTDKQILSLIECNNEEVKQENANKNPTCLLYTSPSPRDHG